MRTFDRIIYGLLSFIMVVLFFSATGGAQVTPSNPRVSYPLTKSGNLISIPEASATRDGFLSSSDFVTFAAGGSGSGGTVPGISGTNPATLGTLKLWLKADVGVYSDTGCTAVITSGGQVGCWADQSGNSLNFVGNATVSTRPRYYYKSQAGHGEIYYNAGASLERASATGLNLPSYTQCVTSRDASPSVGGTKEVFVIWNQGAGHGTLMGEQEDGSSFMNVTRDGPAYPDSGLLTKGFFRADTINVHCVTYDDTTKTGNVYVNGALVATNTGAASVDYSGAVPVIGSLTPAAGTENFGGTIDEILVYNSVLSPAMLGSAINYSRSRWNAGSFQGGGSVTVTSLPDPLTVNGWAPASGTGTLTGNLVATGATTVSTLKVGGGATVSKLAGVVTLTRGTVAAPGSATEGAAFKMPNVGNATIDTCYVGHACDGLCTGAGTCTDDLYDKTASSVIGSCTYTCGTPGTNASCFTTGTLTAAHVYALRVTPGAASNSPDDTIVCDYTY